MPHGLFHHSCGGSRRHSGESVSSVAQWTLPFPPTGFASRGKDSFYDIAILNRCPALRPKATFLIVLCLCLECADGLLLI